MRSAGTSAGSIAARLLVRVRAPAMSPCSSRIAPICAQRAASAGSSGDRLAEVLQRRRRLARLALDAARDRGRGTPSPATRRSPARRRRALRPTPASVAAFARAEVVLHGAEAQHLDAALRSVSDGSRLERGLEARRARRRRARARAAPGRGRPAPAHSRRRSRARDRSAPRRPSRPSRQLDIAEPGLGRMERRLQLQRGLETRVPRCAGCRPADTASRARCAST